VAQLPGTTVARQDVQVRLEEEIAQRDRVIVEGERTEARLRESEMALRQLFDQNLDSMMILDLETGKYIDVNDEYTRNSGYGREEMVGKRSREHHAFEHPEENLRMVAELKRVGVVRNIEATFRRKDGRTYAGLISALNLKFRGHLCCITITRDIGALKETERQLIAAREAALEGSRAKSESNRRGMRCARNQAGQESHPASRDTQSGARCRHGSGHAARGLTRSSSASVFTCSHDRPTSR
jgi:PAS domain S-box-containing protein